MANEVSPRFRKVMALLFAAYQKEPDPLLVEVYWRTLSGLPIEALEKACMNLVATSKHFPRASELREFVAGPAIDPPNLEDEAEIACGIAWEEIRDSGQYRTMVFDDPAIHATIESLGGWVDWCLGTNNSARRKDFSRRYMAHRRRINRDGVRRSPPALILPGSMSAQEPRFIGDRRKILEWHRAATGQPSPWAERLEREAAAIEAKEQLRLEGSK